MSIELTDLRFAYGERVIFDGLTCSFVAGEMTALIGPSGRGKSTLLALMMGQLAPSGGSVKLPPSLQREGRLDENAVAWVMQTANLFPRRSALANVALAARCRGDSRAAAGERARTALASVGLVQRADDRCVLLSGGERQRVAVARALAVTAGLLIADEPTVSLDHENRDQLVAALRRVAENGAYVVVATHDPAVYDACDAVIEL